MNILGDRAFQEFTTRTENEEARKVVGAWSFGNVNVYLLCLHAGLGEKSNHRILGLISIISKILIKSPFAWCLFKKNRSCRSRWSSFGSNVRYRKISVSVYLSQSIFRVFLIKWGDQAWPDYSNCTWSEPDHVRERTHKGIERRLSLTSLSCSGPWRLQLQYLRINDYYQIGSSAEKCRCDLSSFPSGISSCAAGPGLMWKCCDLASTEAQRKISGNLIISVSYLFK